MNALAEVINYTYICSEMERTKKDKKTEVSLLKPINLNDLVLADNDDCFGHMWDPQHRACSVCADVDVCGIVFQEAVVIPAKKKFDKDTVPLDLTNFQGINWSKVTGVVRKYQDSGEPMTYDELFSYIKGLANTKDDYAVKIFMETTLKKNGLRCTEDNKIVVDA
jgi:hypothetical protein